MLSVTTGTKAKPGSELVFPPALPADRRWRPITKPEFTTLITGLSFTECPRWRDGRLYASDFYTHRVLAVAMDGTAETVAYVPQQPSGLWFLPDGPMLIVSMPLKSNRTIYHEPIAACCANGPEAALIRATIEEKP